MCTPNPAKFKQAPVSAVCDTTHDEECQDFGSPANPFFGAHGSRNSNWTRYRPTRPRPIIAIGFDKCPYSILRGPYTAPTLHVLLAFPRHAKTCACAAGVPPPVLVPIHDPPKHPMRNRAYGFMVTGVARGWCERADFPLPWPHLGRISRVRDSAFSTGACNLASAVSSIASPAPVTCPCPPRCPSSVY
jgi:hypothetical protein